MILMFKYVMGFAFLIMNASLMFSVASSAKSEVLPYLYHILPAKFLAHALLTSYTVLSIGLILLNSYWLANIHNEDGVVSE